MATSPNYAWAEPDNSSLVKNGAQDIRALGDAIDTSVWNSGYGQAGKNKIINGDFGINQRGFTSLTTGNTYTFDRFQTFTADGTATYSAQTFTPGAAPVAGYESKNYLNIATTGQTLTTAATLIQQLIEDVRTLAGQTATVSFWAKAASGTPKIAAEFRQNFGAGGSPSAATSTYAGQVTTSTSWARYSITVAIPSISGKTLGTSGGSNLNCLLFTSAGSNFDARTGSLGIQNATIDIWGVQLEYGSYATPFQTASGGSIQGELAMCQRYAQVFNATNWRGFTGQAISTSRVFAPITLPVQMRTSPTVTFSAAGDFNNNDATGNGKTVTTATTEQSRAANIMLDMICSSAGLVAGNAVNVTNANANAVITISAEL
jgi:hypothetical protein